MSLRTYIPPTPLPPLFVLFPELMEAMPEFVEQPLYSENHYVAVVSGSVRNLSQYPEVFAEIFCRALHHLPHAPALISIYHNLITIKRLTTCAISLIKDVGQNEISRFHVTEDLPWIRSCSSRSRFNSRSLAVWLNTSHYIKSLLGRIVAHYYMKIYFIFASFVFFCLIYTREI